MTTAQRPAGSPATSIWTIDAAHTLVEFSAKHMMITTVKGRFGAVKGTITADLRNPDNSHVEAEIDAASLDTRTEQRDQHLKSADFLNVEQYPTITFKSTRVQGAYAREGDEFKVTGDLTIRGMTRPVTLDCTFDGTNKDPWGGERAGFSASTKIDRREWGLTWNQALETGGILVGNDIKISLEVQAVRQTAQA
jgi:polyisoprenoid-binding protein YceI